MGVVAANIPADTIAAPHTKDAEQFMPWVGVQCASPELVTSWVFATVHGWVERTVWWNRGMVVRETGAGDVREAGLGPVGDPGTCRQGT